MLILMNKTMKVIRNFKIIIPVLIFVFCTGMKKKSNFVLDGVYKQKDRNICYNFNWKKQKCVIDVYEKFKFEIEDSILTLFNKGSSDPSVVKIIEYSPEEVTFLNFNSTKSFTSNMYITILKVDSCTQ